MSSSYPQYVLQNLPSRFMSVVEDYNEQTHMAPVPWKRIFYHFKGDAIFSRDVWPKDAAQRTVEREHNKIDFNITIFDEIKEDSKEDGDGDGNGDAAESKEDDEEDDLDGDNVNVVDMVLQEIPDDYDEIMDSSLEVNLDEIYTLRKRAWQKVFVFDLILLNVSHEHIR